MCQGNSYIELNFFFSNKRVVTNEQQNQSVTGQ